MFWLWFFGIAAAVALSILVFFLFWGSCFRVAEHSVTVSNLPKEFEGFRIALISDLHDRRFGKRNSRLVKKIAETRPDFVVMAGDMHEGCHSAEPFYALFEGVSKFAPITYTEGNHDTRAGRHGVTDSQYAEHIQKISQAGGIPLNDTVYSIERNGQLLLVYGQSWRGRSQPPQMDSTLPSLLVTHDPLQFDVLPVLPDLTLSGHVHGGILRLPWIGPVFAPGNGLPLWKRFSRRFFFPKYSRGLYYKVDRTLAVTQGVGFFVLPIRFIRPEIMVLTLKSGKKLNNS